MTRLFPVFFLIALAAAQAGAPLEIPLTAGFDCHTQGFTILGDSLFVTCAERVKKRALVLRYRLPAGFPATGSRLSDPEVTDLTRGKQWHPSGLDHDGQNLWLAVAEYRARPARSTLMRLDPATLNPLGEFPVNDHIGAVAVAGGEVWGFNWDSRDLYRFARDGSLIAKQPSPAGVAFQDCAGVAGGALCSGPDPREKKAAALARLSLEDGKVTSERAATVSVPGRTLGREGFLVLPGGGLAFLPDDLPRAEVIVFPDDRDRPGGQ